MLFLFSLLTLTFAEPSRAAEFATFDINLGQTICYLDSSDAIDYCDMAASLTQERVSAEFLNQECSRDCALYNARFAKPFTVYWPQSGEEASAELDITVAKYSRRLGRGGKDTYAVFARTNLLVGKRQTERNFSVGLFDPAGLNDLYFETAPVIGRTKEGKLFEKKLTGSVENLKLEKR